MAEEQGESVAFSAAYSGNLQMLSELLFQLKQNGTAEIELAEELAVLFSKGKDLYEDTKKKRQLLKDYMETCRHTISGQKRTYSCQELAENLLEKSRWIQQHIRQTEWVGDGKDAHWFNSYYDNGQRQVEGVFESGVRMMLTGQVFSIMSGTAEDSQVEEITKAADKYLYKKEVGGYRLNTDFDEVKSDMGRMFGFAYGQKENGAVFSHMTVMYGNALYQRGFVKEGYQALKALYEQSVNFEVSRIYPGIPEYFNDRGRGMYHYLTGAASWLMLTVVQQMFGVRGILGDMLIEPKLLNEQFDENREAGIYLTFADRKFHLVYENAENKEYGTYQISRLFLNDSERPIEAGSRAVLTRAELEQLPEHGIHEIKVVLQ